MDRGSGAERRSVKAEVVDLCEEDTTDPPPDDDGTLRCDECDGEEADETELERHVTLEHLEWIPFECRHCSTFLPTEYYLRQHFTQAHPRKSLVLMYKANDEKKLRLIDIMQRSLLNSRPPPFAVHVSRSSSRVTLGNSDANQQTSPLHSTPVNDKPAATRSRLSQDLPISCSEIASESDHTPTVVLKAELVEQSNSTKPEIIDEGSISSTAKISESQPTERPDCCKLCGRRVTADRGRHIWRCHVTGTVFECKQCAYKTQIRSYIVQHCRRQHGSVGDYIDHSGKLQQRYQELFVACFNGSPRFNFVPQQPVVEAREPDAVLACVGAETSESDTVTVCDGTPEIAADDSEAELQSEETEASTEQLAVTAASDATTVSVSTESVEEFGTEISRVGFTADEIHASPQPVVLLQDGAISPSLDQPQVVTEMANENGTALNEPKGPIEDKSDDEVLPSYPPPPEERRSPDKCASGSGGSGTRRSKRLLSLDDGGASKRTRRTFTPEPPKPNTAASKPADNQQAKCRLCNEVPSLKTKPYHVWKEHVVERPISCPHCDYPKGFVCLKPDVVSAHIRRNHPGKPEGVVDKMAQLLPVFQEKFVACFGEDPKTKPPAAAVLPGPPEKKPPKCRMCATQVSCSTLEHIFKRHIGKPAFECKLCIFTESFDLAKMKAHLSNHEESDATLEDYFDLRRHYKSQLIHLLPRCFGQRWLGWRWAEGRMNNS